VAGIIIAASNNGAGVRGVAMNAKIMVLKTMEPGYVSDAVEAVDYAIRMGATFSNNSWGIDEPAGDDSRALAAAISASGEAGMLFVAAAGNRGRNTDERPHYPSAYDLPNIVSVAATDSTDQLADFSNFGQQSVDLGAPGTMILSTWPGDDFRYSEGTSMATPHVSGVVALVHAKFPDLSHIDVKGRILISGDCVPELSGKTESGKRLNARNALLEDFELKRCE
jgi:subtilisin family serine protease